jgi:hypothetical protein
VTHDQLTEAVRASELLASSTATRHDTYPLRSSRRGVARLASTPTGDRARERDIAEAAASHAPEGANAGQDGGPRGHAPTCPHGISWCPGGWCAKCTLDMWDQRPDVPDALTWHYQRLSAQRDDPRVAEIEFPDQAVDEQPVPRVIPGTRRLA